jgi:hypothetical protein
MVLFWLLWFTLALAGALGFLSRWGWVDLGCAAALETVGPRLARCQRRIEAPGPPGRRTIPSALRIVARAGPLLRRTS